MLDGLNGGVKYDASGGEKGACVWVGGCVCVCVGCVILFVSCLKKSILV